jgi:hypothetical protein
MKKYLAKDAAKILGVCPQRVAAKLKQGHFPGAHPCECGRSILIPEHDVLNQPKKRNERYEKVNNPPTSKINSDTSNSNNGTRGH